MSLLSYISERYYGDSFEAFKAAMLQVEVFWVVTPCSVVGGPHCCHDQGEDRGSMDIRNLPQR
jgi:hypothetical protein